MHGCMTPNPTTTMLSSKPSSPDRKPHHHQLVPYQQHLNVSPGSVVSNTVSSVTDYGMYDHFHTLPMTSDKHAHKFDDKDELTDPIPPPTQLMLLILDHLRYVRRSQTPEELRKIGLEAHHLSVAIYALSRSFSTRTELAEGNDAWISEFEYEDGRSPYPPISMSPPTGPILLPSLEDLEEEILLPDPSQDEIPEQYEYDDSHASNGHRFYRLGGLASGGGAGGPVSLREISSCGLAHLGAKSRSEAESEMVKSPLFEQFVSAVREKGFFKDAEDEGSEAHRDRYRKVVAKFRSKLALKAEQAVGAMLHSPASGDRNVASPRHSSQKVESSGWSKGSPARSKESSARSKESSARSKESSARSKGSPARSKGSSVRSKGSPVRSPSPSPQAVQLNQLDLEEAERLKSHGNAHMQKREYQKAIDSYTTALKLCPTGPMSHVYFSNRAAALLSLKQYREAILDSERSLALKPDYGKAHARLGLANYLLGEYQLAVDSYTLALKYEPDNKTSKGYLQKANNRLKHLTPKVLDDECEKTPARSNVSKTGRQTPRIDEDDATKQKIVHQKEADKLKSDGNTHMSRKEYQAAVDCYTTALKLCPAGPSSHVYFSNRAAALCYLERYAEAELDSERSLALKPEYGKAHARLGLSRFFLMDYRGAVEAYTQALKYDPNNAASKSYLAKAKARLEETERGK